MEDSGAVGRVLVILSCLYISTITCYTGSINYLIFEMAGVAIYDGPELKR